MKSRVNAASERSSASRSPHDVEREAFFRNDPKIRTVLCRESQAVVDVGSEGVLQNRSCCRLLVKVLFCRCFDLVGSPGRDHRAKREASPENTAGLHSENSIAPTTRMTADKLICDN